MQQRGKYGQHLQPGQFLADVSGRNRGCVTFLSKTAVWFQISSVWAETAESLGFIFRAPYWQILAGMPMCHKSSCLHTHTHTNTHMRSHTCAQINGLQSIAYLAKNALQLLGLTWHTSSPLLHLFFTTLLPSTVGVFYGVPSFAVRVCVCAHTGLCQME